MGLAFSDLPIATDTISANPATFLDDLDALLVSVGWTSGTYLTGYLYAIVSPQSLAVQVRIWDPADSNFPDCFAFQLVSSVSPFPEGLVHHLRMDSTLTYAVWANCCSFFIGRPGVTFTGDFLPWSVCGGIPYAFGLTEPTPQCEAQSPPSEDVTTELWFSSGSDTGIAGFGTTHLESFRSGNHCKRFSFFRNGADMGADGVNEIAALQLGVIRPPGYLNNSSPTGFEAGGILFADGTPMASDPILSLAGIFYGQLYDACLLSKPMALEATEQIYESDLARITEWINHMRGLGFTTSDGRFSSLLLFTGIGGGTGVENVAY